MSIWTTTASPSISRSFCDQFLSRRINSCHAVRLLRYFVSIACARARYRERGPLLK